MRSVLFGVFLAASLFSLPARAGTISHQLTWDIPTTDWVYWLDDRPSPNAAPQVITDIGHRIFEDYHFSFRSDPSLNDNVLPSYTGGSPLEWVHISHDLSMTVTGAGASGVSGSFSVFLEGLLLARDAIYSPTQMAQFASDGTVALRDGDIVNGGRLQLYGHSASYHSRSLTYSHSEGARTHNLWGAGHLTGTFTVTYGFDGTPEPDFVAAGFGRSSVHLAPVPLPASGLLLGGILLIGVGLRRRRPR